MCTTSQPTEEELKREVFQCASMDVFSNSFSLKKSHLRLTQEEIDARHAWNEKRDQLRKMARRTMWDLIDVTEVSQLLSSVLVPPALCTDPKQASKRTKSTEARSKRHYAPELELGEWDIGLVDGTEPETEELKGDPENLLKSTVGTTGETRDEGDEQAYLRLHLWGNFRESGLMFDGEAKSSAAVIGLPDEKDLSRTGENVTMMIEVKASHNLLLPNEFTKLKEEYETSFKKQNEEKTTGRPTKWSHVCHPLAQLFAYMIDNNVRFGVLCSACKAYFCFFEGAGNEIDRVRVSNACLNVSQNYLKHWAWFIKEARKDEYKVPADGFKIQDLCDSKSWLERTPVVEEAKIPAAISAAAVATNRKRDRDSNGGSGSGFPGRARKQLKTNAPRPRNNATNKKQPNQQKGNSKRSARSRSNREYRPPKVNSNSLDSSPGSVESVASIPHSVTDNQEKYDFEIDFIQKANIPFISLPRSGKVLGRGRNGHVFETDFQGEQVAVKQFDLSKNFKSYERELEGYLYLQNVWDVLVPKPKFIGTSPSGMVRFLGLPKGTSFPDEDDNDMYDKQLADIHSRLEFNHKFRHLDSSNGQNGILVGDKVLAIDLENWEEVGEEEWDMFLTPPS